MKSLEKNKVLENIKSKVVKKDEKGHVYEVLEREYKVCKDGSMKLVREEKLKDEDTEKEVE